MRISIVGSFGFKDIGDEAMLTEDLAFLLNEMKVPREDIHIFGGDPLYLSQYHGHPRERCYYDVPLYSRAQATFAGPVKRLRNLAERRFIYRNVREDGVADAIKSTDVLLITGGGTVNTRGTKPAGLRRFRTNSLERMHAFVRYFKHLNIPIFMSGQTIGPLGLYPDDDRMAREIVESVDVLTVRDQEYSKRYIDLIGAKPKKFYETVDDACSLPYENAELPAEIEDFLGKGPCAALNVTEYTSGTVGERQFVSRIAEYLVLEKNLNVVLVSHTLGDTFHLWQIYDMLGPAVKSRVFMPDLRYERDAVLKNLISRCVIAVGGRYHFIVFAGTADVPFVGMCGNHYSYIKQNGFARQIGQTEFILTERETWDWGSVVRKIEIRLQSDKKPDWKRQFPRPTFSMKLFQEFCQTIRAK